MSWADEANAKAHTQWYNPDHGDGDCMKCQVNFQVREGFEMGAKWQREQLRTDEAVERLARHLYERDGQLWPWDDHNDHCGRPEDCKVKPAYFDTARAAIDALLGEA